MPHTSLREAAPTATLSTSAPCPMPNIVDINNQLYGIFHGVMLGYLA
ncbi:hypothetical protein GNE10_22965 [Nostoc sp. 2RC]|nr:hypothetical protein [Nostoc sp. 2RC]